ncbi:hypothetical protein J2X76_003638 [Neorhizobium sp. 2083]|uniref:hypothetical protein n=1 Tax=Neorhizobium sp. 2083 TaxID=2817762 RepID=UPI002861C998|nr:hypothetical protein [Neorhizobium sp. 2083]MDR6818461.1 hypothetical protein [Neorhizobium sp. 2083]
MHRSFAMLSSDAAHKLAMRTRHAYIAGQFTHEEFVVKRARQEIVAHNRFETLLARMYPNHKPDLIEANVLAGGRVEMVKGASL